MDYEIFEIYKNGTPMEGLFLSIEECYQQAINPERNFYEFVGVAQDHKRIVVRYGQGRD